MNILITIPCLLTGGTEIQTLSLVKALINDGHSIYVACLFEHSPTMIANYQNAGANVCILSPDGSRPKGIIATLSHLFRKLKPLISNIKPDIAHVQYMAPGALTVLTLRLLGVKKIIATAHTAADIYSNSGIKQILWLNRHILSAFQCITLRAENSFFGTSSLFSPQSALNKKGNHFTIYNNIPSYISPRQTPRSISSSDTTTIGVVSRLEPIKGMDLVIPAFARIQASFPNTRLLIVGDGSLRAEMEKQANKLKLASNATITFVGRKEQSELQECYDSIDILLMPSRSEGFGLTAIEGMARGCAPVVANVGGLPEVIRDQIDGLLHKPDSADDIAEKIAHLLKDKATLRRYSSAAIERAQTFTTQQYNRQIAHLYHLLK